MKNYGTVFRRMLVSYPSALGALVFKCVPIVVLLVNVQYLAKGTPYSAEPPSVNMAQTKQIGGHITDQTGTPLAGVTVTVKGTSAVAITDETGAYRIVVPEGGTVLVFTTVGFEPIERAINNDSIVNVSMTSSINDLDEVVVVGYSTQKKINLTGAVDNVNLEDVQDRVLTDASQILQGKSSGVLITQISGQPGRDNAEIRIRGISSIDNNNDPLVIIDGVESTLRDVNPNDIASISVLKDASAASIYGNRAAGGVLIVTTKEGKSGLDVNYVGTVSMQEPTRIPEAASSTEFARGYNEGRLNSGLPEGYTEEDIQLFEEGILPEYQGVNLYDEYFSNAVTQNHYLSARGGQAGSYNFSVSGGYLDQDGILVGTDQSKVSYMANVNTFFLNGKLKVSGRLLGYDRKMNELVGSTANVLRTVGSARSTAYFKSSSGLYSYPALDYSSYVNGGGTFRNNSNLKYQFGLELKPVKSLTWNTLYANQNNSADFTRFSPNQYTAGSVLDEDGVFRPSSINLQRSYSTQRTFNSTLRFDPTFDDLHHLSVLAGYEAIEFKTGGFGAQGTDLSANLPILSLADPASIAPVNIGNATRTSLSFFGRVNYNYDERYLLEANIRRDGSSRFMKDKRWGTFPSVSAGWVLSKEPFFGSVNWLDLLKLRGSWGLLGNSGIGTNYAASDVLSAGLDYNFGGTIVPGTAISLLANRNTTWETTEQLNIGLDVSILKRLNINVNYFDKETTDILARITIPGSLGVSGTPYQNVGTMSNKGFELSLEYNSNPAKEFQYSINGNVSYQKNRVIDIGPLPYIFHSAVSGYSPPAGVIRSVVGESFGSYFGMVADGIYQIDDFNWQNNSDPNVDFYDREFVLRENYADPSGIMQNPMPGDIKFRDLNDDGIINDADRQIIGKPLPDYIYSLNLNGRYKNFELNILTQGVLGADAYIMGAMATPFWNGTGSISKEMYENRWTPGNPSTTWQRLYDDRTRANLISSYYLQNASYLRLKNITLGYSFSPAVLHRLMVKSLKVFVSVENVFTVTSLSKGFDPEKGFNRITSDFHPQIRTTAFGLNIGL
ncbi:SusC/RagA family TonB-linked outer membrane protein [Parapedobacter tibetensis]|uniref:SusC/RagA family TonB-linked outer membrane protein n=1 Tax=Parapedobacter tibetensis TaxID=2972951 RepID=UPI00214D6002|nr:TonB-dependent receptor [Parapedobacter tibetensis]